MNARTDAIGRRFAADLEDLRDQERHDPAGVEAIVYTLVAHLRSWRPEAVSPLGTLPAPTERIRDPRATEESIRAELRTILDARDARLDGEVASGKIDHELRARENARIDELRAGLDALIDARGQS